MMGWSEREDGAVRNVAAVGVFARYWIISCFVSFLFFSF